MSQHPRQHSLDCANAFKRIARAALRDVQRGYPAASRGDADGIHRMRIGLTRLVAARKFFAAMVTDETWPGLKAEIVWLNGILGDARDNDVARTIADEMAEPIRRIDRKIRSGRARVVRALSSKRYRSLLVTLRAWIDHGSWTAKSETERGELCSMPLVDLAARRLAKWSRRLARYDRGFHGRRQHRARILAKRYRYMVEAFTLLGLDISRSERRMAKAAKNLQRALGDLRDLRRVRHQIDARRKIALKKREAQLLRDSKKILESFA